MMRFEIHLTSSAWRSTERGGYARGTAFLANGAAPICLVDWLVDKSDQIGVADLQELNGFFSVIVERDNFLLAAVDRVRSMPLFYGQKDNCLWISDDCDWVRGKIGFPEVDPICREELLRTGYVTGRETLFPGVYQLQAGEYLTCGEDEKNSPFLKTDRYYRFLHVEPEHPLDHQKFERSFLDTTTAIHERVVAYANGRQIVIPLSGGYDSRLIASMLRKLNYDNVMTFTYGLPGNEEAKVSEIVARSLGYDWRFVPYSDEMWKSFFSGIERVSYNRLAYGGTSLPHPQDWPAIEELKRTGAIESDCVVVPGHSGDFVAGSHIPKFISPGYKIKHGDLYRSIVDRHYNTLSKKNRIYISDIELKERIENLVDFISIDDEFDLANAFELWDWQERQAKYIVNSVKVYDYFGLDWWLPLWENEFVSFWENCSLRVRVNLPVYQAMVNRIYSDVSGHRGRDDYQSLFYEETPSSEIGVKYNIRRNLIHLAKKNRLSSSILKFIKYKREKIMPNSAFGNAGAFMEFLSGGSMVGVYAEILLRDIDGFGRFDR